MFISGEKLPNSTDIILPKTHDEQLSAVARAQTLREGLPVGHTAFVLEVSEDATQRRVILAYTNHADGWSYTVKPEAPSPWMSASDLEAPGLE